MKWTKITEDALSLPTENVDVLVYCQYLFLYSIAYIDFQAEIPRWYHQGDSCEVFKPGDITHWAPLEKPKDLNVSPEYTRICNEYAGFASDEAAMSVLRRKEDLLLRNLLNSCAIDPSKIDPNDPEGDSVIAYDSKTNEWLTFNQLMKRENDKDPAPNSL